MNQVAAAPQSHGLTAPSSRQDVVSALLSAYGNSFEHGEVSPSSFSPVPANKELPPPPPRRDSLRNKPLPAVQRAEQRMSMKFQLRVIEDAPLSPNDTREDSPERGSRKKILYRSLSREAKPPSLKLVTSNGSTAIVPPTPLPPTSARTAPVPSTLDTKDLPSPPPPPPEKSERRPNAQQSRMGLQQSKSQTDLARNDSLLSQGETKPSQIERPSTVEAVPVVKRKAVPGPAAKKFVGLAQLGTGPRGGKGGPLPPASAPRKASADDQGTRSSQQEAREYPEQQIETQKDQEQSHDLPTFNQLPPTPDEDKVVNVAPAPPRKALTAIGLPSNPRARGGPVSPKHVRGKSSTGFSLLKAQRPAPPIPSKQVETLTPEMTPSPTLKPEVPLEQEMSPLSPLPEQGRPFSFEPMQAPTLPAKSEQRPATSTPPVNEIEAPTPSAQTDLPPRMTSLDHASSQPSGTNTHTPSNPTLPMSTNEDIQSPSSQSRPPTPPPFTPLTRTPVPLPSTLIPSITRTHLHCYTSHVTHVWSNNTFQPMGCMICHANAPDRKWACTWCRLRICVGCSEELMMVPGRSVGALLEVREKERVREVGVGEGQVPKVVEEEDRGHGYEDDFA
ncbi:hypothetical protein EK21DRAFT_112004 [Setomelanomma holmii]|uniref:Uncharacterized protein n=1 Tax=Setomelanomma holmii TaxID=210430 RepID=A0A9P4H8Y0_9PLEO|nr:hypothetical protein EK21DRAFT_112004 [Setomelanomma holmii]